jgi:hypothetical protein
MVVIRSNTSNIVELKETDKDKDIDRGRLREDERSLGTYNVSLPLSSTRLLNVSTLRSYRNKAATAPP